MPVRTSEGSLLLTVNTKDLFPCPCHSVACGTVVALDYRDLRVVSNYRIVVWLVLAAQVQRRLLCHWLQTGDRIWRLLV